MTSKQLKDLETVLKVICKTVSRYDRALKDVQYRNVDRMRESTLKALSGLDYRGKTRNRVSEFIAVENITPFYIFSQFGEGGSEIFRELQRGADKLSELMGESLSFMEKLKGDQEREILSWSKKATKVVMGGVEMELTAAERMSLYLLSKREQAKGHIYQGGVRFRSYDKNGKDIGMTESIVLTEEDVKTIIGTLNAEQIAIADRLQQYMATECAQWGNEISMMRWGIEFYLEENYFPITVDKTSVGKSNEQNADAYAEEESSTNLYALLNRSFNKKTVEGATNPIIVGDVFDVFAKHTYQMMVQNAFGPALMNLNAWIRRSDYDENGKKIFGSSVHEMIDLKFGKEVTKYLENFVADLNGTRVDLGARDLFAPFVKNAKLAAVGLKLKTAVLQPLSYIRALNQLELRHWARAILHPRSGAKKSTMMEKSGIAKWNMKIIVLHKI